MNKGTNFRRAAISSVYAISLTPEKKRLLMQSMYAEAHQSVGPLCEEQVRELCIRLNQCYEVRYESIACAMEIILKLLGDRVATEDVLGSYRKLLSYVSSVLDRENCAKLANYMSRISSMVLKSGANGGSSFPVQVMKCILVLMYRCPIASIPDRKTILQAVRSLLDWCKTSPTLYGQCGISALVRTAISSTKVLQDDVTIATELTVLAHHLLDVFLSPQSTAVHPVEVLLRLAYEQIFARLVTERCDVRCFELLLFVLYNLLKRDIYLHLKLGIVRTLADAAGGGTRRLVRLLCAAEHLRNEVLLRKTKTVLTLVLAHSLFRYEPVKRAHHFKAFLALIETMINAIDLDMLAKARFLCLSIPRARLSIESICFVFAVRHLDLLEGGAGGGCNVELDYVYNLIASVNIIYYKRWKIPSFLVKHVIDGLSRFSNTRTFEKNVTEPRKKLQAILAGAAAHVYDGKRAQAIFGRLPATLHRIQWLQLQPDDFGAQLIFHQQLAILQERSVLSGDETRTSLLVAMFDTQTLVRVLSMKKVTATARLNASVLLSKRKLTGQHLHVALRRIGSSCTGAQGVPDCWTHWVRAVYGTVPVLDSATRRQLWSRLATVEPAVCTSEQRLLLVDMRASLLVAMIPETNRALAEDSQASRLEGGVGAPSAHGR
ncbi:uncharacterized protein LOC133391384 [Anopheles gambiae]|uniref:uncharacterized protein LOC133391384 n=1 Tax=Anopheles gambiae TaxID=7165 RepID=UPI002AC8BA6A|nr:uncharacterized protein LOC133391384 [Anopheles gambiae]